MLAFAGLVLLRLFRDYCLQRSDWQTTVHVSGLGLLHVSSGKNGTQNISLNTWNVFLCSLYMSIKFIITCKGNSLL